MRKIFFYIIIMFVGSSIEIKSQVGIGTSSPNSSSMMDIYSTNKGILFPTYSLTSLTNPTNPVNNPSNGLIIYNSGGIYSKGLYYWYVNSWNKLFIGTDIAQSMVLSTSKNYAPNGLNQILNSTTTNPNKFVYFGLVGNNISNSAYNATASEITLPKGKYKIEFSADLTTEATWAGSASAPINSTVQRMYYVSFNTYLKDTSGTILAQNSYDNEIITHSFVTYYTCFYLDLPETKTFSFYLDRTPDSNTSRVYLRTSADLQIYQLKDF